MHARNDLGRATYEFVTFFFIYVGISIVPTRLVWNFTTMIEEKAYKYYIQNVKSDFFSFLHFDVVWPFCKQTWSSSELT